MIFSTNMLILFVLAPFIIISIALSSTCLCGWFRKKPTEMPSLSSIPFQMTQFISAGIDGSYILCNLRESNLIGSGGGGKVFKVILRNEQVVAVKKICSMSTSAHSPHGVENGRWEAEEKTVGVIRHKNIIKLLCSISIEESDSKLLVFEFMSNGSLFDYLHGDPEQQMVLPWPIRYKIAQGVARGLSYIHHDCSPPILHRDVKSSNILLDADFEAKIADFGISRFLNDRLGDEYMASGYVGSHGYIAPEYGHGLKVSEKSDIYSFGVVLLELVSGMKPTNEAAYGEGVELVQWIRNTITMGGGEAGVLDRRVKEESCIEQILRVLRVGLLCTHQNPRGRPPMRTVVEMLESCL